MGQINCEDMLVHLSEFTLAEVMEMQILYKKMGKESPTQELCQELATTFSSSIYRTEKAAINWKQVQSWFQDKQKRMAKIKFPPGFLKEYHDPSYATTNKTIENPPPAYIKKIVRPDAPAFDASKISQKPKGERVAGLSDLVFEAKSSKDLAWYDVASFLSYRVPSWTGELEVRVRFAGFRNVEDEWVNLKRGVRERSIPLMPSECHKVKVGDTVLCFRDNGHYALYDDATIVNIEREMHDKEECTCVFVVRYAYDNGEAIVDLGSICCRPT